MKKHGLIVADNGSNWYISGAPDPRWSDDTLGQLKTIPGSAFEAVLTIDAQGNPIKPTAVLPQPRAGRTLAAARKPGSGFVNGRWTYYPDINTKETWLNLQGRKMVKK